MRGLALVVATSLLIIGCAPFLAASAQAQGAIPQLILTINGQELAGRPVFAPSLILVPQVPIEIIVTFHNNETTPNMQHSFTLDDSSNTRRIDTDLLNPGQNATVNFTVLSMTRIRLANGTEFTPEASGAAILFYCVPHRTLGMTGQIALATAAPATPEKGILVRAYWIGIIGIAAMLVWIGISYFLIKSSSRHFTDHREHVRKGLP